MVDNNEGYIGFAASLNTRLASETRLSRAYGLAWSAAGLSSAIVLSGLGLLAAFWGYSYVPSTQAAAEKVAVAISNAFKESEIKAVVTGTMALSSESEIRLAPNQIVSLAEGAKVHLDPNSSIRVVGDLKTDIPQPSKKQLQVDGPTEGPEIPFTTYVIFRSVPLGAGEVVTGWNYTLDDNVRPKVQYCYYQQILRKGIAAKYTLAIDGAPQQPSSLAKLSFDFEKAVANCVWFSGA